MDSSLAVKPKPGEVITTQETQPAARQFPGCWTIYYRHGVNAQLSKNFYFDGTMFDARERAQRHCGIMGYKFNFLRPMLCDIEVEEGIQLGTHDNRTGLPFTDGRTR